MVVVLICWAFWAVVLYACNYFNWGIKFTNDTVMYIMCAPVIIPIYAIGVPIALCARLCNNIKYNIEKRKR